jgi:hypothetical protein
MGNNTGRLICALTGYSILGALNTILIKMMDRVNMFFYFLQIKITLLQVVRYFWFSNNIATISILKENTNLLMNILLLKYL